MNSPSHYLDRLRRDGLTAIVKRKLNHRWNQLRIDHMIERLLSAGFVLKEQLVQNWAFEHH